MFDIILDPRCVNDVDGLGRTPLMYAVHASATDTVQVLLDNGADPNITANGKLYLMFRSTTPFRSQNVRSSTRF